MYIGNKRAEDNIFYNIGLVKGKIEVLSDTNITRSESEVLKILDEIKEKMNLIYIQAVKIETINKKIEVPLFRDQIIY